MRIWVLLLAQSAAACTQTGQFDEVRPKNPGKTGAKLGETGELPGNQEIDKKNQQRQHFLERCYCNRGLARPMV